MTRNFRRLTFSVKQFCQLHDNFFHLNVGALFAAVATLETICTLFGAAIFNSIYPLFLRVGLNGFSFLVMAFLMIAALILTEWVQCSLFWFVFHCFRFSGSHKTKAERDGLVPARNERLHEPNEGCTSLGTPDHWMRLFPFFPAAVSNILLYLILHYFTGFWSAEIERWWSFRRRKVVWKHIAS